ncbi:MAG: UDP-sulfoquinovose synthase [Thermoplasmata archaeon]
MKVLIAGIDGYTGWPLALHLLSRGHEVVGLDNFITRRRVREVGGWSATPIPSFPRRQANVERLLGKSLRFHRVDVTKYEPLRQVIATERPDAIVHLAEQRSAPYSMIDVYHAVETQVQNLSGTINFLYAIEEEVPECHFVKMGTMGEYGTPNVDIPEGFFEVNYHGRVDVNLPFPRQAGSWYHWSKVFDSGGVMFATRAWGLRATDVMQGVVYGVLTPEITDNALLTRFDFDDVWGTALNRFVAEAVLGLPITPYGKGEQSRGFIALEDSMQSLRLAIENPPAAGEYRVFNQFDAAYTVNQLAEIVRDVATEFGLQPEIQHPADPRVEAEEHYYRPIHDRLPTLGYRRSRELKDVVHELFTVLLRHRSRLEKRRNVVMPVVQWRTASSASAIRGRSHAVAAPAPPPVSSSAPRPSTSEAGSPPSSSE